MASVLRLQLTSPGTEITTGRFGEIKHHHRQCRTRRLILNDDRCFGNVFYVLYPSFLPSVLTLLYYCNYALHGLSKLTLLTPTPPHSMLDTASRILLYDHGIHDLFIYLCRGCIFLFKTLSTRERLWKIISQESEELPLPTNPRITPTCVPETG